MTKSCSRLRGVFKVERNVGVVGAMARASLRSSLCIIAIVIVITNRNRNRNRNVNGNVNGIGNCNGNGNGIHLSVSSISEAQDPSNRFDALEILTLIVLEAR